MGTVDDVKWAKERSQDRPGAEHRGYRAEPKVLRDSAHKRQKPRSLPTEAFCEPGEDPTGSLAPAVGLEPTTRGLTVRCSTN